MTKENKDTYKVFEDEEERPATKSHLLMCRTWEIKFGSKEAETLRADVQKLHDDRKEWQTNLREWIMGKLRYKKVADVPCAWDHIMDPKALQAIEERVIKRVGLKLGNPAQKTISEAGGKK